MCKCENDETEGEKKMKTEATCKIFGVEMTLRAVKAGSGELSILFPLRPRNAKAHVILAIQVLKAK
jgi:hypothetical protein